ncbi:MAG: hypothetical protein JSR38_12785 [Proteobacteria bacterium]|nr:hypothetical protein [Pseudomonadota bacterium]
MIKQQFGAQLAAQAVALSLVVASSRPLTKWEERSSADRRRVLENVQRLADDLAELIDANGAPPVPMALALFDRACMPGYALAEALAVGTEPSDVPATAKLSVGLGAADVPEALRPLFDQRVGPLLRSLATWAASHKHTRPRDTRPNTGAPGARVLARRVASWVESHCTARMPATLIADIVNLAMPDLASPVTAENVKEWGKAK